MLIRFFILFILVTWFQISFAADQLIFAIDIIRHGDRNPYKEFLVEPYTWVEGLAELTPLGMQQVYELGKQKRKEYIDEYHLLPAHYSPSALYVRSTDYNRTLMSAQSFLLGFYPLQSGPKLADGKFALPDGFQPIPIHSTTLGKDSLLFPLDMHTKAFNMIKNSIKTNPLWRNKLKEHQEDFLRWSKLFNEKINIENLQAVNDNLFIRQLRQIPLPKGLAPDDARRIAELGQWSMLEFYKIPAVYRLMTKELLSTIVNYLHKATNEPQSLRYVLYSAHDVTILTLLNALGQDVKEIPPYVSNLGFLLFQTEEGSKYVQIIYNKEVQILTGCEANCPLKQFEEQLQGRLGIKPA